MKIKQVELINFNSKKILKDELRIQKNLVKLEFANKKSELKKSLVEQKLKGDEKKKAFKNLKGKIEDAKKSKVLKINEITNNYQELIKKAILKEKEIIKIKQTNEEKNLRKQKVLEFKKNINQEILANKKILKNIEISADDKKTAIQNIKNLKKNRENQIDIWYQSVKLDFFENLGYKILLTLRVGKKYFLNLWDEFVANYPTFAQFMLFWLLSTGVTILQLIMLPIFKEIFNQTNLANIAFQFGQIGKNLKGDPYFMFDYPVGQIAAGGGGLSYFLAVQISLAIAQIINFFVQKSVTFKSKNNVWIAAMWYFIAYVVITLVAAAAQGLYKTPIYSFFEKAEVIADFITMLINSTISFWVFFPIMKIIFKEKTTKE